MNKDNDIICVECGTSFGVDDADDISYATGSIKCPFCGRYNYEECTANDGFTVESFDPDESCEDTDELYTENYFSDDLEYDGENKYETHKYKKIGVAKRKNSMPKMPTYEYRKAIDLYRQFHKDDEKYLNDEIDEFLKGVDIEEAEQ